MDRAPSSFILHFSRSDGPNHPGDSIGLVKADLLTHRSDRTREADVLDDGHERVSQQETTVE